METSILNALIMKNSRNNHLSSSKLYLNRRGTKILSNTFMQYILHNKWQVVVLIVVFSKFDFGKYGSGLAKRNCQSILNLLRKGNLNKLIFAHSNINSIKICLAEQVKGNIDHFRKLKLMIVSHWLIQYRCFQSSLCRKLIKPSRTFKDNHHFKMVDLRIMKFWSFIYEHVAYCAKNRTNLLFMLGLPMLGSYLMMKSS